MTEPSLPPFQLDVDFAPRIWGRRSLAPWYARTFAEPIGEAWLTGAQNTVATGEFAGMTLADLCDTFPAALRGRDGSAPLLVKLLFPEEKLSVQVHPDEQQAARLGDGARAKTECWYVLDAQVGASVALGLRDEVVLAEVEAALGLPAFESLLAPLPVAAGDLLYVPSGTVHAIGGGMTLLEVQQPSDTTFRLYDYGRDRDLHLDNGLIAIKLHTAAGKVERITGDGTTPGEVLIDVPHFRVVRQRATPGTAAVIETAESPQVLVGLRGHGAIVTAAVTTELCPGHAIIVPAGSAAYRLEGDCDFVRCALPAGG